MFGLRLFTSAFNKFSNFRSITPFFSPSTGLMTLYNPAGNFLPNMQIVRFLNRNARRPKRANRGKRPVSHARRHEKRKILRSVAYRTKIFGFW